MKARPALALTTVLAVFASLAVSVTLIGACDSDGNPCPAGETLFYPSPGCGDDAKPACEPTVRDGCAGPQACGCDGKTFVGACGSLRAPYSHVGVCEGDDPWGGGPCPLGQSLYFASPGCGIDATPVCEPTIRDACAGPAACSCDGKTISGACGSQTAPYARLGSCEDDADDGDAGDADAQDADAG